MYLMIPWHNERTINSVSDFQIIESLQQMLNIALNIISKQATLLAQHDIQTIDCLIDAETIQLQENAKRYFGNI